MFYSREISFVREIKKESYKDLLSFNLSLTYEPTQNREIEGCDCRLRTTRIRGGRPVVVRHRGGEWGRGSSSSEQAEGSRTVVIQWYEWRGWRRRRRTDKKKFWFSLSWVLEYWIYFCLQVKRQELMVVVFISRVDFGLVYYH